MKRSPDLRFYRLALLLAAAFALVLARLAWMQLGPGRADRSASAIGRSAALQRSDSLMLDSGRGQFTDRGGKLLTGETVRALAAFPEAGMPRGTDETLGRLAAILGTDKARLTAWLNGLKTAEVWREGDSPEAHGLSEEEEEAVRKLDLTGVAVLPYRNRYPEDSPVSPLHAIGYVSQNPQRMKDVYGQKLADRELRSTDRIGGAGLELSLDRLLLGAGRTEAIQVTDAARRPLQGLGLRVTAPDNPHYPLRVKTTLNLDAQRAVEQVLRKRGVKEGAVVVLNAANADVLAMASLPAFDPDRIGLPGADERNHALIAVPPGSVFKTVTLAAALEAGVTSFREKFRCGGHYGRYGLMCWRTEGHGELSLEEAYAESCNVVFAALAERLNPAMLQKTADRMGIGRQVGWYVDRFVDGKPLRLLPEEQSGSVFLDLNAAKDGGVRTGAGIGQRDVRMTPLQAANLAVTLLHDGQVLSPRIVSEIRYADGGPLAKLAPQASPSIYGSIRPSTAAALRRAMRAVVLEGTAERALRGAKWPLAGKSGTAELAGAGSKRNDHWFVGYGPAEHQARYAVAVLIENVPAGSRNRAASIFGDVMEALRRTEAQAQDQTSPVSRK